jgi:hypothetical protein
MALSSIDHSGSEQLQAGDGSCFLSGMRYRALVIAVVLAAPLAGCGSSHTTKSRAVAGAAVGNTHHLTPCSTTPAPAGTYPSNQSGQTYGSAAGACPAQAPDLISAVGRSKSANTRIEGYVLRSQLEAASGGGVNSPRAAVAWTRAHAGKDTTIPLYARDGETIIGQFTVGQ